MVNSGYRETKYTRHIKSVNPNETDIDGRLSSASVLENPTLAQVVQNSREDTTWSSWPDNALAFLLDSSKEKLQTSISERKINLKMNDPSGRLLLLSWGRIYS
jgi:hypothetical protein